MMNLDDYQPHPPARTYTGKIYFRDPYAFLLTTPGHWAVLQFDPNLNCNPDLGVQRKTAIDLHPGRHDEDPFTVRGIEIPSIHNPRGFILFWDVFQ